MNESHHLAAADGQGRLYPWQELAAVGRTGEIIKPLSGPEWIPLPPGSSLVSLPGRVAVGLDKGGLLRTLSAADQGFYPVAALLPMGYARTYLPAARAGARAKPLPLFGYTAVSFYRGRLYTAAMEVEADKASWDPRHYNTSDLPHKVRAVLRKHPHNRILQQLAHCSLNYSCFTAQNIFYRRWEAGLPVSPLCNARCVGCISKQASQCCPSPQERISFVPSVEEIVEVALPHLLTASGAIISFGQGCEGEPSLVGNLLVEAVQAIRARTGAGLININTNGSRPAVIQALARAGLDSVRISLISPQPEIFDAYVRPRDYSLAEVKETLTVAREEGLIRSLNYLVFPGVSDREEEVEALLELLRRRPVDLIQLRNLNIDPDVLMEIVPRRRGRLLGLASLPARLQAGLPQLAVGSFTRRP